MNTESQFGELENWVMRLDSSIEDIKEVMRANTEAIAELQKGQNSLKTDTAEIIEYFKAIQGFFKVLEFIGKLGRPLLYLAVFATVGTAVWTWLKSLIPWIK